MNSIEETPKAHSKTPSPERRSFIWKMGAVLSAAFASTFAGASELAGLSRPGADESGNLQGQVDRLSHELGMLEDAKAIHKLHQAYGHYLDQGLHEEIVNLFAADAEVHFNGGIFLGRDQGVRRLYLQRFGQGLNAQHEGPVHGFLLDHAQQQDAVEVAPDRKSAKARFHCLVQAWARDTSEYPMMDLARQQGQGILQWWEGGLYENSYVKEGEAWKIKLLDYRPQWQADCAGSTASPLLACWGRLGWSYARPGNVPPFSKTYPEDPAGPDKLIPAGAVLRAETEVMALRYPHPVTGKLWGT
jgi:hypothetical protein